ncbi:hypothetical protein GCM10010339_07460 [Streptomyces alanosinicus]|uniref:Uncharacterized protein n=1 Tax=Streptomyces alanosinicus TaxID=68171 RepID=A0A919CZE3_9ACTN|nr:hypothetical protein GCM10010339_07460 [Streptomyces alanosinicus]
MKVPPPSGGGIFCIPAQDDPALPAARGPGSSVTDSEPPGTDNRPRPPLAPRLRRPAVPAIRFGRLIRAASFGTLSLNRLESLGALGSYTCAAGAVSGLVLRRR